MFEKLFVKTSDLVFHQIAPYGVERERFLDSNTAARRGAQARQSFAQARTRSRGRGRIRALATERPGVDARALLRTVCGLALPIDWPRLATVPIPIGSSIRAKRGRLSRDGHADSPEESRNTRMLSRKAAIWFQLGMVGDATETASPISVSLSRLILPSKA